MTKMRNKVVESNNLFICFLNITLSYFKWHINLRGLFNAK